MATTRRMARHRTPLATYLLTATTCVLLAATVCGPAYATPDRGGPTALAGAGLVLTANPPRGPAPLLVDFRLSTPNGTAPRYSWSFGDGGYLNGSDSSYAAPSHVYDAPGSYPAVATAFWPSGPENASLTIVVLSSALSVHLVASPVGGAAPLTVTFNATPQGGSGTYLSYLWNFGDGGVGSGLDIRYTYVSAGSYVAEFTVTDSTGANASAEANVTVTAGGPGNDSSTPNGTPDGPSNGGGTGWRSYLPAISVGLLVGGVTVFLASAGWVLYRRRAAARSTGPVPPLVAPALEPAPTEAVLVPTTAAPSMPSPMGPAPTAALPAGTAAPAPPEPSGLAATRRLTLHLLRQMGRLPKVASGELPGPEWTQAGLAAAVGAGQSAISRVLRRLTAAGIVETETTHVAGGGRRLRVYRLTPRGERLAHALSDPDAAGADARQDADILRG
jgi:DNA-binding MarR family transcriptional regulator